MQSKTGQTLQIFLVRKQEAEAWDWPQKLVLQAGPSKSTLGGHVSSELLDVRGCRSVWFLSVKPDQGFFVGILSKSKFKLMKTTKHKSEQPLKVCKPIEVECIQKSFRWIFDLLFNSYIHQRTVMQSWAQENLCGNILAHIISRLVNIYQNARLENKRMLLFFRHTCHHPCHIFFGGTWRM